MPTGTKVRFLGISGDQQLPGTLVVLTFSSSNAPLDRISNFFTVVPSSDLKNSHCFKAPPVELSTPIMCFKEMTSGGASFT